MTLLDDFKQFVTDAESGQQYIKWAHDNPVDLSRWHTFRDAILASQRPTVPTMSTPHGRELIDAGVEYLDATVTVTPPPPPPVTDGLTRHFGFLRLGSIFETVPNPSIYGLACGSADDADLVAKLPNTVKRVVYTSAVDVPSWWAGLSQAEVIANHWALGTEVGGYFLDIGIPEVQAQWTKEVGDYCVAHKIDGVYADDFVSDPLTLMSGTTTMPSKYPTVKDWHDKALIPFAKNVFGALKAKGIYIGANVIAWFPRGGETTIWPGSDSNNGTASQGLYREICPYLSWIMLEGGFYPNHYALRKEYVTNPQYPAFWKNYKELITIAENAGCDFYATVDGPSVDAAVYTRATFEITSNGRMGGALAVIPGDPATLGGNWMKDLGAAKGPATQSGNVFTRQFANGTVTIDPYAGTASIT